MVNETFLETLKHAIQGYAHKKFSFGKDLSEIRALVNERLANNNSETDPKTILHLNNLSSGLAAFNTLSQGQSTAEIIKVCQDILAGYLDEAHGSNITDHRIFKELAEFWEADFMEDMKQLQVVPPSVLVRVSEVIPEILVYIQQIMQNGFAYEADGSVYFDVAAFDSSPGHRYAKLCPKSAGNPCFFEEGEGSLGVKLTGKRDPRDFALWKASKPGEPWWESPWGKGRPGWHIECSVMANCVLPGKMDIHSGGIDLAFPHHDNEIAQAEAYSNQDSWVNYFLHAGHVHIEGHKMSKSLKNFISIKDALRRYTSRQIRMFILLHQWNNTVIFKESAMDEASAIEKSFGIFLGTLRGLQRDKKSVMNPEKPNEDGLKLLNDLYRAQEECDIALRDSFDTPRAIQAMRDLMGKANIHLSDHKVAEALRKPLQLVGEWIAKCCPSLVLQWKRLPARSIPIITNSSWKE